MIPVAYGGNNSSGPISVATACLAHGSASGRLDFESETFVTHTGIPPDQAAGNMCIPANYGVRRLTPRECERLQGFPDDYTRIAWRRGKYSEPKDMGDDGEFLGYEPAPCPDGPRYKAIGNSMAVPVMRWIGRRLQYIDEVASIL